MQPISRPFAGRGILELAFVAALGFALWALASTVGDIIVSAIAQTVNDDDISAYGPFGLSFSIGNTEIDYGRPLATLIAIGLLLGGFVLAARWRSRSPQ